MAKDIAIEDIIQDILNPLPPSDAVQKQKKNILEGLFRSVMSQFKKYHLSGNLGDLMI